MKRVHILARYWLIAEHAACQQREAVAECVQRESLRRQLLEFEHFIAASWLLLPASRALDIVGGQAEPAGRDEMSRLEADAWSELCESARWSLSRSILDGNARRQREEATRAVARQELEALIDSEKLRHFSPIATVPKARPASAVAFCSSGLHLASLRKAAGSLDSICGALRQRCNIATTVRSTSSPTPDQTEQTVHEVTPNGRGEHEP